MGTVHSSSEESPNKMPLADRRYRVSASKAAKAMKRRSTRKLGSVALEVEKEGPQMEESGGSGAGSSNNIGQIGGSSGDEDGQVENGENGGGAKPERRERKMSSRERRARAALQFQLSRTENAANTAILLTRTERVLIENSWKRAKKAAVDGGIGAKVFHMVLMAQPDIKMLFGLEKVPQGRLKYEGQFRRHAVLLNRSLEYIVKNVQYTEKLGQHFQALGKKHCQMNGGRAFPASYWDTFLECIIQGILEADGASGGHHHRCRETSISWRNLISFILQQMRRGFDDERLLRKRFSASLMGLRGSVSTALSAAYNGGESAPQRRAATGRPRPSLIHHTHGSLGSLEKMTCSRTTLLQHPPHPFPPAISLNPPVIGVVQQRARAASAVSPLAVQTGQNSGNSQKLSTTSQWDSEKGRLEARADNASPSARSASWCAEVAGDELRRLQLNEQTPKRATRSELVIQIDDQACEAYYTPMMTLRNEHMLPMEKCPPSPHSPPPSNYPQHAVSSVQLLLNADNPMGGSSSQGRSLSERVLTLPEAGPNHLPRNYYHPDHPPASAVARHSFSEFVAPGNNEKAAAVEASRRLFGLVQNNKDQLQVAVTDPAQHRRLSAI